MAQPNDGDAPSPLAGLAGGAEKADADTSLMPPPPPRTKMPPSSSLLSSKPLPLQNTLNPLMVGATVVSASGPSQKLHNVRWKGKVGVAKIGKRALLLT